jgi:hypothetical protein
MSLYPFTAVVGQEDVKEAIILNLINPSIGGVLIDGKFTPTGKEWKTKVVPYQADPDYSDPAMVNNWNNAHIVVPFGGGAWGGKLKVRKVADKVK